METLRTTRVRWSKRDNVLEKITLNNRQNLNQTKEINLSIFTCPSLIQLTKSEPATEMKILSIEIDSMKYFSS